MTDEIKLKEREIATPGEIIATGMGYLPGTGTYRDGDEIRAERIGMLQTEGKAVKILPLAGVYLPHVNDVIICRVTDILMSGWRVDTYSAYSAVLSLREATTAFISRTADLTKFFEIGEYVVAKVTNVTSQNLVDVSMKGPGLRKLPPGRIVRVNNHKVPRVIGKKGSMVSMIKDATKTQIEVGQNGVIWLSGIPKGEAVAAKAIEIINEEAHKSGLTERIKQFLEASMKEK